MPGSGVAWRGVSVQAARSPGSLGRCRLRAPRSITASPEPPANMAPLTPALPLPAGLPWRCPPAQPPPARRCVFTSGRRSRSPSAVGDGHTAAGRPPSLHPRRAVLRETRHEEASNFAGDVVSLLGSVSLERIPSSLRENLARFLRR
ncbi:uncharacterized protein LOC128789976 isoform X1 [Vidua chalybeata]|uniref:uncharacterized protein LOC128789976 isoform X1 n=1 Tax=Vidua chalybeata TaxID=81927 RepID=UPI0023A7FF90|nr:uncharacterized protein LOC128789976 isoform X1 [Vidua chalybeata]